jgi:hypothetical protein
MVATCQSELRVAPCCAETAVAKPFKMSAEGQADYSFLAYMLPAASAPALDTAATPSGCVSLSLCCCRSAAAALQYRVSQVLGLQGCGTSQKAAAARHAACLYRVPNVTAIAACDVPENLSSKHVCLYYREETELQWIREYDYAMRTAQNDQVRCMQGKLPQQCKSIRADDCVGAQGGCGGFVSSWTSCGTCSTFICC